MRARRAAAVLAVLLVAACAPVGRPAPSPGPAAATLRLLELIADRPEFVGAGFVGENRHLVITVHGNPLEIVRLADAALAAGTEYEIRTLQHGLPELRALMDRIVARELAGPIRNERVTLVDVDELRGLVVVGFDRLDDRVAEDLTFRYGPLIVVEQHPRGVLLSS
jgi:hypothetical protein